MSSRSIYLVRHARAEKDAPKGDAARPLTAEGRAEFQELLGRLRKRLDLERILTSPFVRARETAELLAKATGAAVEVEPRLASGAAGGGDLLALARRAGDRVALVGHNPEIAEAVAIATRGDRKVPPGTVARVELGARSARLAWLEAPERED